jgi:peptide/nickel transport system substrate-binding protein
MQVLSSKRVGRRRSAVLAAVVSLALIAGACGNKKDEDSVGGGDDTTPATEAPGGTDAAPDGTDAASTTTEAPIEPVYGGTLVVAGEAEAANPWTPAAVQCDSFCQMRARTFYDPIVVVNENLEPEPYLAETITPNEDYTVWTVKLREGISFHDGTPFNAEAAVYNLKAAGGGILISAAVNDLAKENGELKIIATDEYTFDIYTGKGGDPNQPIPWPGLPYYLGGQWGFMASPAWLEQVKADPSLATQAVGTGPFILDSYTQGDKLVVTRNPNYWATDADGNSLPYLDSIEFRVIADSQVRAEALESGDVDLISTSDAGVVSDFVDHDTLELLQQDTFTETNYILFHLTEAGGPLQDQSVRCALGQAIDKQDLIDVIAKGYSTPANGPFSPGQEGYLEDNGSLPYDPDAAAAAIEAYEAANGPITINYSTTTTTTSLNTAQYLQTVWGEIGVDVTIDQIEQSKLINNALFGDPGFQAFGWRNHAGLLVDKQNYWWNGETMQPDGGLALNFGRLNDPVINDLLAKARSEQDPDVRRGYAEDINRQFAKECWIIPTSFTRWGVIHKPDVQGVGRTPLPGGEGFMRDGAGFPGQVWLTGVFRAEG